MADDMAQQNDVDVEHPSLFKITQVQKERMDRNRMKAKSLKHGRLVTSYHPYKGEQGQKTLEVSVSVSSGPSRGGYMLDTTDRDKIAREYRIVDDEDAPLPGEETVCHECSRKFALSFLKTNFNVHICDECRRGKDKYKLVSKTEAKETFCLKDVDLEERDGPPLPFICRRNPHNPHGGSMKLYLESQVRLRAHAVWGGEDGLLAEKEKKQKRKEKLKQNKYEKKIKELRRAVSGGGRTVSTQSHQHLFPPDSEVYNEDDDTWSKTCSECGYTTTYEKM
jgi:DNA-repair protein complementing XP-A cells